MTVKVHDDVADLLAEWGDAPFFSEYANCRAYVVEQEPEFRFTIRLTSGIGDVVLAERVLDRQLADFIVEMVNARLSFSKPA